MYIEGAIKPFRVSRNQKIVFIALTFVSCIGKLADLFLNYWFKYCWWRFGLIFGNSFAEFTNFRTESLISDIHNDSCESIKELVSANCPDFCDNLSNIEQAGVVMFFFGLISIFSESLCLGFHIWKFLYHNFRFDKIWVVIVAPKFLFALGFFVWYVLVRPDSIQKVDLNNQACDFSLGIGFYLSISIIAVDLFLMLFGLIKTRKEFLLKKEVI
jgi:hypothetical protein